MTEEPGRYFTVETVGDVAVVRFLEPKIVSEEATQEVGEQLYRLVEGEGRTRLVLDFTGVQFLFSPALGKLINLKKKVAKAGGQMKFCSVAEHLAETFRITRLDRVFEFEPDVASAIEAIHRPDAT